MDKKVIAIVGLMVALGWLTGCATMSDVVEAKHEGTSVVYSVNADQAWEIAKAIFRWEGADMIEDHRDEGYVLASSGMNAVSWGTVMGAWIDPVDENSTKVTVVTKRRVAVNVATTLTETTFHKDFAYAVNILLKAGKPLPETRPEEMDTEEIESDS